MEDVELDQLRRPERETWHIDDEADDDLFDEYQHGHSPTTELQLINRFRIINWFMRDIETGERQGYRSYFIFNFWTIILNTIIFLISMISFGKHLSKDDRSQFSDFEFMTLASYSPNIYGLWVATTITIYIAWFIFAVWFVQNDTREQNHGEDDVLNHLIEENRNYEIPKRQRNKVISWTLTFVIVSGCDYLTYYITYGTDDSVRNSFIIAAATSFLGFCWNYAAFYLTKFEHLLEEEEQEKSYLRKLLIFRFSNAFVLYIATGKATNYYSDCVFKKSGEQFFFILLSEIILLNPVEFLFACISLRLNRVTKKHLSDRDIYPEFDVSFEYMEVFYRQFVILHGIAIFPMLSIMGAISTCFEVPLDKYKYKNLTRPKALRRSNEKEMLAYLTIVGIFGFFCYPFGPFWLILRPDVTNYEGCSIFD